MDAASDTSMLKSLYELVTVDPQAIQLKLDHVEMPSVLHMQPRLGGTQSLEGREILHYRVQRTVLWSSKNDRTFAVAPVQVPRQCRSDCI